MHKLTDAFSLSVSVETQEEVDTISDALIEGGGEQGPCGWLVDAFGLSWQIVPTLLMRLLSDPDPREGRPDPGRDDADEAPQPPGASGRLRRQLSRTLAA